jgi:putative colanic acid biosynthesis acetyltransferase WcaF
VISICIPSYNYFNYLPFAVESCLGSANDIELIVLDNCSSDATPSLRERYEVDPRVRWIRNDRVLPIHENWNKAVSLCTRPYVKMLHADDVLKPGAIEQLEEMIRLRPKVAFHGHLADIIDYRGRLIRRQPTYGEGFDGVEITGLEALRAKLFQQARFHEPSSNMFLKSAWEAVGGYSGKYRFMMDIHFNVRMASRFPSALWNRRLVQVRRHRGSDGAHHPMDLPLGNLRELADEILAMLGDAATDEDRAAARGWIQYRLLELCGQRFPFQPRQTISSFFRNASLLRGPLSAQRHCLRLLRNKILNGDPQDTVRAGPEARIQRRFKLDLVQSKTRWDGRTLFMRVFWAALVKPLFLCLPRPFSKARIELLRMMGAQIGRGCLVEPGVKILMPWNIELGDHVAIGRSVEFLNFAPVRIDSMTVVSQYCYLCTGTHDYTHPHFPLEFSPIVIGAECWIAAGAFVGPGVNIGRGAVIGARAVVTRNMPAWMVCAGNPCKPLKRREVKTLEEIHEGTDLNPCPDQERSREFAPLP